MTAPGPLPGPTIACPGLLAHLFLVGRDDSPGHRRWAALATRAALLFALSVAAGATDAQERRISPSITAVTSQLQARGITRANARAAGASEISNAFARVDDDARVQVYIHLSGYDAAALDALRALEVEIEIANAELAMVQGWMPFDRLDEVAALPFVRTVTPPSYAATRAGATLTEGDSIVMADALRTAGLDGSGVRVGVISDGANDRAEAQASGDLPADVTIFGSCTPAPFDGPSCSYGKSCNEGTAIAEIVHDLAPGAGLAVASASTSLEFIERVNQLVDEFGAHVVIDDIGFLAAPYFADGPAARAVAAVIDRTVYVSSAGNSGTRHYEAAFRSNFFDGVDLHDFGRAAGGSSDVAMSIQIAPREFLLTVLQWNDPFGGSSNDYDMFFLDDTSEDLLCDECASVRPQEGPDDPIEWICYHNDSGTPVEAQVAVSKFFGFDRRLELFARGDVRIEEYGDAAGSVFGHSGVVGALAVGAIDAQDPGNDDIEPYSSHGPARVDYPSLQRRHKPDVVAVDGVSVTGAGGFPPVFFGTSASAPHVAGVAALLRQQFPDAGTEAIRAALISGAVDLGTAGPDETYGSGLVDALNASDDLLTRADAGESATLVPNGDFETGALGGFTAGGIDGGTAGIAELGTCFSSRDTTGLDLGGAFAALLRPSAAAPTGSVALLTSPPFVAGTQLRFQALSESDDTQPERPAPVTLQVRLRDESGSVLLTQEVETDAVRLAAGCPGAESRDGDFGAHVVDTSGLAGLTVRVEFRQHTNVPGKDFFTLIDDVAVDSPTIVSPEPGAEFEGTSVTFEWTGNETPWSRAGPPTQEWWLYLGSGPGESDLFDSGSLGASRNVTVESLPGDGRPVHARLWYRNGSAPWASVDYEYTAPPPPEITSPASGTQLPGADVSFQWNPQGNVATAWWLYVGSAPGDRDLHDSGSLPAGATSHTVTGLPTDGRNLFVRLFWQVGGAWLSVDVPYTAAPPPPPPEITSPASGTQLPGADATFQWNPQGNAATAWWLYVGSAPGDRDLHDSGSLAAGATSHTVTGLPTDGRNLFVRLFWQIGGAWLSVDVPYTAAPPPPPPEVTSPASGTQLPGADATFQWNPQGNAATAWWLYVGSAPGDRDLHDSGSLAAGATSHTVTGLPTDGRNLFVRLFWQIGGAWLSVDVPYAAAPPPPRVTSPVPGAQLSGADVTFTWDALGNATDEWMLDVGSMSGASDLHASGSLAPGATSHAVIGLPVDGRALFVRLSWRDGTTWRHADAQYQAYLPLPAMTTPEPGTELPGSVVTLQWDAMGNAVTAWWLNLGSAPGASDLHSSGSLPAGATSHTVTGLPTDGRDIFVRLFWQVGGAWLSVDVPYTAAPPPPPPEITSPASGTQLPGADVTFQWNPQGNVATAWWLYVGSAPGDRDLHDSGSLPAGATSHTVTGLPTDGRNLFVRLFWQVGGAWLSVDVPYTAAPPPPPPEITSPTPGTQLPGADISFQWNPQGNVATAWWLYVGSAPGDRDLHDSGSLAAGATSHTVTGLPTDGRNLFVRLFWQIGGAWLSVDVPYTAAPPPPPPEITSPVSGTQLPGADVSFQWNPQGNAATAWWLYVGSAPGDRDLHDSGSLPAGATSHTVTGLPTDGRNLFVRLFWQVGGAWLSVDVPYTAAPPPPPPEITSPASGTQLPGADVTFQWNPQGNAATAWWLYVGSAPGDRDLHDSGSLAAGATSHTVTGLPTDGRNLFVRLFWQIGGAWLSVDVPYTAAPPPPPPEITVPPGPALPAAVDVAFGWDGYGRPITGWWVNVGTSVGSDDIHSSGRLPAGSTSYTVPIVPSDGSDVFVRLWFEEHGSWIAVDHAYDAASITAPTMTNPLAGAILERSERFEWSPNGTPATEWWLFAGSSPGARDYHDSGALAAGTTSTLAPDLATDGRPLHVRLFYEQGIWKEVDFVYTAGLSLVGFYTVSGSTTTSGCTDPTLNGSDPFQGSLHSDETRGSFGFAFTPPLPPPLTSLSVEGTFTASLDSNAAFTGTFNATQWANEVPVVQLAGPIQGSLSGRTITASFSTQLPGETCIVSGSFSGNR